MKWKKKEWRDKNYRGKVAEKYTNLEEVTVDTPIYKEHNHEYLIECIENLREKGIHFTLQKSLTNDTK